MHAIPHDQQSWLARNRIRLLVVLLLTATYVNSYLVLSSLGDYDWSMSGQTRYAGAIAVYDRIIWQPRFLSWEPHLDVGGEGSSRGNLPGYLYSPLIRLDRAWWHPTSVP